MYALEFCYSLQGFAELSLSKAPTGEQWAVIKEKLDDVEYGEESYQGMMDPQSFVNWLKGFVQIAAPKKLTIKQWTVIKEHLGLVFTKVTIETVEDSPLIDVEEIMKEIEDRQTKPYRPPYPQPWDEINPYRPEPWSPPYGPTCDKLICASTTDQMYCAGQ